MTPPDRDTKLRAVAAHFKLMGWEPGKMCEGCDGLGSARRHEIPPPDPADPAVRVALEDALVGAQYGRRTLAFYAGPNQSFSKRICIVHDEHGENIAEGEGDTPADALLDAAYQLVRREEKP